MAKRNDIPDLFEDRTAKAIRAVEAPHECVDISSYESVYYRGCRACLMREMANTPKRLRMPYYIDLSKKEGRPNAVEFKAAVERIDERRAAMRSPEPEPVAADPPTGEPAVSSMRSRGIDKAAATAGIAAARAKLAERKTTGDHRA